MEIFSALLALCAGKSPVTGEFPSQRPVARSFDVFFDLRLNKRLSKQPRGWWFETPSCSSWRHCNASGKSCLLIGKYMYAIMIIHIISFYSLAGVKQCTLHWLISHDITQKEMVLNSLIIHHLIVITCISYEITFTISLPKLINIAPL